MSGEWDEPSDTDRRRLALAVEIERWMDTGLRLVVSALRNAQPLIACGATDADPRTEDRIKQARDSLDVLQVSEGCGRLMVMRNAYRCAQCGRWFHRACIVRHFEQHRPLEP